MALYGNSYDSLANQRQFLQNLDLEQQRENRLAQAQAFEQALRQAQYGAGLQSTYNDASRYLQANDEQRRRDSANMLLRLAEIQSQDQRNAALNNYKMGRMGDINAEKQYGLAQADIQDSLTSGIAPSLSDVAAKYPALTPPHLASLNSMLQAVGQKLTQTQQAAVDVSQVFNRAMQAKKLGESLANQKIENEKIPYASTMIYGENPNGYIMPFLKDLLYNVSASAHEDMPFGMPNSRIASANRSASENIPFMISRNDMIQKSLEQQAAEIQKNKALAGLARFDPKVGKYVPAIPVSPQLMQQAGFLAPQVPAQPQNNPLQPAPNSVNQQPSDLPILRFDPKTTKIGMSAPVLY